MASQPGPAIHNWPFGRFDEITDLVEDASDLTLFVIAAVVRGIGRQDDQAAVDWKSLELDREAGSFLVREDGSYLGPALLRFGE
jgi:hypothetical protein